VNPKRVYRLMREDNLLCVHRRKFVVTTDSNHTRRVYPNLARSMILTAPDHAGQLPLLCRRVLIRQESVTPCYPPST
jgi:hypothetical protein